MFAIYKEILTFEMSSCFEAFTVWSKNMFIAHTGKLFSENHLLEMGMKVILEQISSHGVAYNVPKQVRVIHNTF